MRSDAWRIGLNNNSSTKSWRRGSVLDQDSPIASIFDDHCVAIGAAVTIAGLGLLDVELHLSVDIILRAPLGPSFCEGVATHDGWERAGWGRLNLLWFPCDVGNARKIDGPGAFGKGSVHV